MTTLVKSKAVIKKISEIHVKQNSYTYEQYMFKTNLFKI